MRAGLEPKQAQRKAAERPGLQDVTRVPMIGALARRVWQADASFQSSARSAAQGGWFLLAGPDVHVPFCRAGCAVRPCGWWPRCPPMPVRVERDLGPDGGNVSRHSGFSHQALHLVFLLVRYSEEAKRLCFQPQRSKGFGGCKSHLSRRTKLHTGSLSRKRFCLFVLLEKKERFSVLK